MSVADIFEERAAFSFEVFPPKTDVGMEKLCGAGGVLEQLYTLNPDYISCTYGAGGTNVGKNLEYRFSSPAVLVWYTTAPSASSSRSISARGSRARI